MKLLRVFTFIIIFTGIQYNLAAQANQALVLIQPTGKLVNNLPEMTIVADSNAIFRLVDSAYRTTFVGEAVKLYYLAQLYMFNRGEFQVMEPAYLAVTKNQGGFAKQGFYLVETDGTVSDKSSVHYIDLTEGNITAPFEKLSSVTQLYPHELMHAIYKMLSYSDTTEMISYNVNMHYFSVITDHNTAFNEGFAEHMEKVAVFFEPSETIRKGKSTTIEEMEPKLRQRIAGFKRDYRWPLRIGYYKASMLLWYQQYEDYKRNVHATGNNACFMNSHPELSNTRDMIILRNAGLDQDASDRRNLVQQMASEGFISTFFTHLALNDLGSYYRPGEFYRNFLVDTAILMDPGEEFSQLQNLFLKYFHVLHNYVNYQHSDRAQLIDFIDGYIMEFPEEASLVLSTYRKLTGNDYNPVLPPPLWLMVKDYDHPVLVMDPYGAITVPVYTFDLNVAETADLLTIRGIDSETAEKIIEYRDRVGLFRSFEELKDIQGLDKTDIELLLSNKLDEQYLESLPEENISISALIVTPLLQLLKNGMLAFIVIGIIVIGLNYKDHNIKQVVFQLLKKLAIWILFLVAGLASLVFSGNPVMFVAGFVAVYFIIVVLVLRKNRPVLTKNLVISLLMAGLMMYWVV
jgi:hypothetical protein